MKSAILGWMVLLLFCTSVLADIIVVDPNGSADFDNIQDAIDYSSNGDVIEVRPATYNENILFNGRAVTLTSTYPDDFSVVASTIISSTSGSTITFNFGEGINSVITGFTIVGESAIESVGGFSATPTITKNIITGISYGTLRCGGIISNNIISGSSYGINCEAEAVICNNVIIDNTQKGILLTGSSVPSVPPVIIVKNNIIANNNTGLYCAGGYANSDNSYNCFYNNNAHFGGIATAGIGDFVRAPLFADGSDYRLKSSAGRWLETGWIFDDVNSPCIDTGDPCDPIGFEPNSNGGRINIGAYGGTAKASKSPSGIIEDVCISYPHGDLNNDCKVDLLDFSILTTNWLDCVLDPPEACWE